MSIFTDFEFVCCLGLVLIQKLDSDDGKKLDQDIYEDVEEEFDISI